MENKEYITTLVATTGYTPTLEQMATLETLASKLDINKLFFELASATPPKEVVEFTDLQEALLAAVKQSKDSKKVQIQTDIKRNIQASNRHSQDAMACLRMASELRLELEALHAGSTVPQFREVIAKVQQDPFWHLHHVNKEYNNVEFISGNVIMRWVDKTKEIDMTVDFGKYKVIWCVVSNKLTVHKHENNVDVDSYIHPHVSPSNSICWGNGQDSATKALMEFQIGDALKILQIILHTYNDESPYIALNRFYYRRHPEMLGDREIEYVYDRRAWITEEVYENINVDYSTTEEFEQEDEDDDGNTRYETCYKIRVYKRYYKGTGETVDSNNYYCDNDSGEYLALESGDIYEWA